MLEDRPIRDQGAGGDFCPYKPALLWLRKHIFPFHLKMRVMFPLAEKKHQTLGLGRAA